MRLGPDGALYVANNGGLSPRRSGPEVVEPRISGRLQRVTEEGAVSDVAVNSPVEAPCRPNDVVLAANGDMVFTDPQIWEDIARARARLAAHAVPWWPVAANARRRTSDTTCAADRLSKRPRLSSGRVVDRRPPRRTSPLALSLRRRAARRARDLARIPSAIRAGRHGLPQGSSLRHRERRGPYRGARSRRPHCRHDRRAPGAFPPTFVFKTTRCG
jgi:hypothetical protein